MRFQLLQSDCDYIAHKLCRVPDDKAKLAGSLGLHISGIVKTRDEFERLITTICASHAIAYKQDFEARLSAVMDDIERYYASQQNKQEQPEPAKSNDCPHCVMGKVELFTSSVDCDVCGGTGEIQY